MALTLEAPFKQASIEFIMVQNACLVSLEHLHEQGEDISDLLNLNSFPPYAEKKQAYITAFEASLEEIQRYQAAGVAHYNPAYLTGASAFILELFAGVYDHISRTAELQGLVVDYTNLYNTGRWTNIFTYLQEREIGRYSASFIGWYKNGGAENRQSIYISLHVSFIKDNNVQSALLRVGVYWTLLSLKEEVKDQIHADGTVEKAEYITIWGPDGMKMQPDTKVLADFALKEGDSISVDFPGASTAFG